jgi:hypothetical protein
MLFLWNKTENILLKNNADALIMLAGLKKSKTMIFNALKGNLGAKIRMQVA